MAYRLRLRATELDLPYGELTIGRGTDCFLRIDDDLVSRRHARLLVTREGVTLEDLGSRNGSRVNGVQVQGSIRLQVGDEVEIGAQTFRLLESGVGPRAPTATLPPIRACPVCKGVMDARAESCPHCGVGQGAAQEDSTRSMTSFELLLGVGDKMLSLGRTDEAERMLGPRLKELLARAEKGDVPPPSEIAAGMRRGVRLAASTRRPDWYAWIFELARLARYPIDDATLDELHAQMLVAKPPVAEAVQAYLDAQTGSDPATGLRRKRIEALLRFCR